jgi:serine phosphatase RsbU (regulator of sigma subunit)
MSNVQASVRVLIEEPGHLAAQVGPLNRTMAVSCPGNCFITLFAAVLDEETGELLYCNADTIRPFCFIQMTKWSRSGLRASRSASRETQDMR